MIPPERTADIVLKLVAAQRRIKELEKENQQLKEMIPHGSSREPREVREDGR